MFLQYVQHIIYSIKKHCSVATAQALKKPEQDPKSNKNLKTRRTCPGVIGPTITIFETKTKGSLGSNEIHGDLEQTIDKHSTETADYGAPEPDLKGIWKEKERERVGGMGRMLVSYESVENRKKAKEKVKDGLGYQRETLVRVMFQTIDLCKYCSVISW